MKVRKLLRGGQVFFCPGCKHTHAVNTTAAKGGPRWTYNDNADRPTFAPSIKVTAHWSEHDASMKDDICHSFVADGIIQYLGDCTHELAGQFIVMPEWPYAAGTYGGIEE